MRLPKGKTFFLLALLCLSVSLYSQRGLLRNPVLAGFYPDPSICRAGDDYYLINSSFAYFPGLPIFHSRDLLNWEQIGHVLDRPEQLPLDDAGVSRGLFAPSIHYHNGKFYVVCTLIDKLGNFVVTATDPRGPWSDPIPLPKVDGIDPSIFFDDNGKSYIVYNSIPPDNKSLWNGHRTIRMREWNAATYEVSDKETMLINGGTDTSRHPVWIEGPHIYKKDGYYYLLCAEGGTAYNHSSVIFRSKSVAGPYVSFEANPIMTQRDLDPARPNPVTTTGHADFVETPSGEWWAVFLACRPYEGDHYNTGRETFMAPVTWNNGWPAMIPSGETVKYRYPINAIGKKTKEQFNNNYIFTDRFRDTVLNKRYVFLRTPSEKWYSSGKGALAVKLRPETCGGKSNPSFIGFRQPHLSGDASVQLQFNAAKENEQAGLLVFQNEKHYYFLALTTQNNQPFIGLYKGGETDTLITGAALFPKATNCYLKIEARQDTYAFYFSMDGKRWQLLADNIDAKYLSTKTAGGFTGCLYAMYATSSGMPSQNTAVFKKFTCTSRDKTY
jgi:xylan 1,4-beta-xylosidase